MAKVWFVRREGGRWVAPGGMPAYEAPLSKLVFPLDLGPQRLLVDERPAPEPGRAAEPAGQLTKVIIESSAADLDQQFTWFQVGFYDSPYSPLAALRRLETLGGTQATSS